MQQNVKCRKNINKIYKTIIRVVLLFASILHENGLFTGKWLVYRKMVKLTGPTDGVEDDTCMYLGKV
jgi:hypothetical protein